MTEALSGKQSDKEWEGELIELTPRCPQCRSTHVESRHLARRFGGAIGAIVGTIGGVAAAAAGMEIGLLDDPAGTLPGVAAGIVIDGIVGGVTWCAAGSRLGSAIDKNILRNLRCRGCAHTFTDTPS